jgi:hypothetical protein
MHTKTRRRLRFLVVTLIIICSIIVFQSRSQALLREPAPTFHAVKKDDIISLTFKTATASSQVYKKNGQWYTKKDTHEFKADTDRITAIIDSLLKINKNILMSTNKNKFSAFGIGPQKVTFKTPTQTETVYIGDPTPQYGNYVRFNDENEIYATDNLSTVLYPEDYLDLSLHIISDENSVTTINLSSPQDTFTLTKEKNDWMLADQKANHDKVAFFINGIKTLKATDIKKFDRIDMEQMVTLTIYQGRKETQMEVLKGGEDTYYLRKSNDPNYYQISSDDVTSLSKTQSDLL